MTDEKISPFESFTEVYKVLIWAGFFKLLKKPKNRFLWICHQIYRSLVFLLVIVHNLVHIIFIIQRRHNFGDVFDVFVIEVSQLNLLTKILAVNFNIPTIDKINKLICDPIFQANTKKDEEMLLKNTRIMHRCVKIMNISATISGTIWVTSLFGKRFQDPTATVSIYSPFETDSWIGYSCSVMQEITAVPWIGHGHLALDCLIATYYAQAEVQLKIIKYNLEHLFDTADAPRDRWVHRDVVDKELKSRFVHFVQRYKAVAWYTKSVGDAFNNCTSFQFFSCSISICLASYTMSFTPITSLPFAFMVAVLFLLIGQLLLYCYFGNMVQYESDSVITSIYLSDWVSTSPQFRRLLLIAMLRWSQNITPRFFGLVPLSLTTFVSVLRFAYSLFAVLKTKQ